MLPLTKINRNSLTFCPPHPGLIEIVFDLSARGRLETVYLLSLHSFPEGTRNSRGRGESRTAAFFTAKTVVLVAVVLRS